MRLISILCLTQLLLAHSSQADLVPLYTTSDDSNEIPDEFFIKAKSGSSFLQQKGAFSRYIMGLLFEMELVQDYSFGDFTAMLVRGNLSVVESLRPYIEHIAYIAPNKWVYASQNDANTNPPDTPVVCLEQNTWNAFWGLSRINYVGRPSFSSATYRYSEQDDGSGVVIYVVDSGIAVNHNQFSGRARHGYTAPRLSGEGPDDLNGHGTHVASISVGRDAGVAKGAQVVNVKVLDRNGRGTTADVTSGLEWILNNVAATTKQVINLSLGSNGIDVILDEVINQLLNRGLPVVVAAGNDAIDSCRVSPAHVSRALTVGATTQDDTLTSFSNFGTCIDVLAPGQAILGAGIGSSNTLSAFSGTSQAAPFVTGVVARYLSAVDNDPSVAVINSYITSSASRGYIDLPANTGTPNRLLFAGQCGDQQAAKASKPTHDFVYVIMMVGLCLW